MPGSSGCGEVYITVPRSLAVMHDPFAERGAPYVLGIICSTHCVPRLSVESDNSCHREPLLGVESYLRWIRQRIISAIKI